MNFEDQVVLVTGGSRGIGKAIACAFAQKGASLIINYGHDQDMARETESEILRAGGKAQAWRADITLSEEVGRMFSGILERYQRLDVLVNNAGVIRDGHMMLMSEKDWDEVIDTNLKGTFHCCRAALRPMIAQKSGRIINLASPSAITGRADKLCRLQGRSDQSHEISGPGSGLIRDSGQCRLPRNHPNRTDRTSCRKIQEGILEHDPSETIWPTRRDRFAGALPGFRRSLLHHRPGHLRGWRHGVKIAVSFQLSAISKTFCFC